MDDLVADLIAAIESSYGPTWDSFRTEFTWDMGLDEPLPRGQFNAFLAAAEAAGPGAWKRLSPAPLPPCPQIVGVDFPDVALRVAERIDDEFVFEAVVTGNRDSDATSFSVDGVSPSHRWVLEGADNARVTSDGDQLIVRLPRRNGAHRLRRSN